MRRSGGDARFQRLAVELVRECCTSQCCLVLALLTILHGAGASHRLSLQQLGAIDLVLAALRTHGDSSVKMASQCLTTLGELGTRTRTLC